MPRDGSGNYALSDTIAPATNADANELQAILDDIATALDGSMAADGQTPITGSLKASDGTAALPAYSFNSDLNSGLYRIGADNIGLSLGGTKRWDFGTAGSTLTGTLDVSGAATFGGDTHVITSTDAGATVAPTLDLYRNSGSPANSDFLGSIDFNGKDSGAAKQLFARIIAQITDVTAASEDAILLLQAVVAGTLTTMLQSSAAGISIPGTLTVTGASTFTGTITGKHTAPTVQKFTSGSAQTYTPTAGMVRIRGRIIGGGGGGAARVTNAGGTGGTTSFENWTSIGGSGGAVATTGGAGGTGGTDGTGTLIVRFTGAKGGQGSDVASATPTEFTGGNGASSPFGGAGPGGQGGGGAGAGQAAAANTGSGGGGAGSTSNTSSAGGGGAAEYVEFWMTAAQVGAGVTYTVGAAGAAGAAGTVAGGAGAAGVIVIEEFYS